MNVETCPTCGGSGKLNNLTYGDLSLNPATAKATRAGRVIDLTVTEYRLLEYLMTNRYIRVSKNQIYAAVWGSDFTNVHTNTIQMHICTLRKKLGDPPLIHTMRGHGYILKASDKETT